MITGRETTTRAAWIAWMLAVVLAVTALAGCGGNNASNGRAPRAATPAPAADGAPSSPYELLRFAMPDTRAAAYRPDGTQIAIASGKRIWLYSADLEPIRSLDGHTASVRALAWSPDGTRLASSGLDNTIRIWSPDDGTLLTTLTGDTDWVFDVAWSPDGTRLVSGSADNTLREWDAATGAPITVLGSTRVESVLFQLADNAIFDTISDLTFAETILKALDAEPLTGLVERLKDTSYRVTITFDDPAFVARLLALSRTSYTVTIASGDEGLDADLAALTPERRVQLALVLNDPDTLALVDSLEAAQATITRINARDDADLLQTVRSLRRDEIVIVITNNGETTTVPTGGDFVATLAGLQGDYTVSFGVDNQEAIAAKLSDKDFLAALQQLDDATATVTDIGARDDADLIRLVQRLRSLAYTLTVSTGDDALNNDLAALDDEARITLLKSLTDAAFVGTLQQLDSADNVVSDVPNWRFNDITTALGDLPYTLELDVDGTVDPDVAALSQADLKHLIGLLQDLIFGYKLDHRDAANQIVSDFNARDDAPLITLLRATLQKSNSVEVSFSVPVGTTTIKETRRIKTEAFAFTVTPQNETSIADISALDNAAIADRFHAEDPAWLDRLTNGDFTVTPALDEAGLAEIEAQLAGNTFSVIVQREQNAHTGSVTAAAWSPDGTWIASAGADLTAKVWDAATGRLAGTYDAHTDSLTDLAWSPDGTQIATASWDGTAAIWPVDAEGTPGKGQVLKGHAGRVTAVAWSPDGAVLATGGRDGTVRLWDAASGAQIAILEGHVNEILALTWSPDGARLVSSGQDGTTRVWDAAAALATP